MVVWWAHRLRLEVGVHLGAALDPARDHLSGRGVAVAPRHASAGLQPDRETVRTMGETGSA